MEHDGGARLLLSTDAERGGRGLRGGGRLVLVEAVA
jgi:hypothetical protein